MQDPLTARSASQTQSSGNRDRHSLHSWPPFSGVSTRNPVRDRASAKGSASIWRRALAGLVLLSALTGIAPDRALAAPTPPKSKPPAVRVLVLGDSLADGIWAGLYWESRRSGRFEALRFAKNGTGLSRADYYNWEEKALELTDSKKPDAVVMMVGINDRQALYATENRKRYRFRSEEWLKRYTARTEAIMRHVNDKGIPLFWIGLPIMRDQNMRKDAEYFNGIYKQSAAKFSNVFYVPLWNVTLDENGQYSSYRRDDSGQVKKFRASDGVHFTMSGYSFLASHITASLNANIPALDGSPTMVADAPAAKTEPGPETKPEAKTAPETGAKPAVNTETVATEPEKPAKPVPRDTQRKQDAEKREEAEQRWASVRGMLKEKPGQTVSLSDRKDIPEDMPAGIRDSLEQARITIRDSSKATIEVLDSLVNEFEARDAVISRCENRINELVNEASVKMGALSKLLDDVDMLKGQVADRDTKIRDLEQQLAAARKKMRAAGLAGEAAAQ